MISPMGSVAGTLALALKSANHLKVRVYRNYFSAREDI